MAFFVELRMRLKAVYADYDMFIRPLIKFIFSFAVLFAVQHYIGYAAFISSMPVLLICSAVCAVLPFGGCAVIGAVFILLDMYEVSLVLTAVAFVTFLVIAILYYGFRPGNGFLMALIPLMFILKIPFAVPLITGLCFGAPAVFPAVFGSVVYFLMEYCRENAADLHAGFDIDAITADLSGALDSLTGNRYMMTVILAFVVAILVVSIIKSLGINHAWTIAIIAGLAAEAVVLFVGGAVLGAELRLVQDAAGIVISAVIAFIYEFMFFAVDYRRTEFVQFEDDDYCYYVKAVPKVKYYEDEERAE